MSSTTIQRIPTPLDRILRGQPLLIGLIAISIITICIGYVIEAPWLGLLPPICILGSYLILLRLPWLLRSLFFLIPLSAETNLSGGLSTDFIGEPILWILLIALGLLVVTTGLPRLLFAPISALLALHLLWTCFAGLFAFDQIISLKYAIAKLWYIAPLYVLPFYLVEDRMEVRWLLKCFVAGLFFAATFYFFQHWQEGLSYMSRTNAGQPIWRNHVNYACTLVLSLPMIWYLHKTSKHLDRWLYLGLAALYFIFLYFAFTRIAYLCLIAAAVYVIILKSRLTRLSIIVSLAMTIRALIWLASDNQYLHLAPDFDKAIMQQDFERKISATASGEDISTMERIHRWVAGAHMIADRPLTGVGPANFYGSYRPYTIYSFETYVSDNPERSGIHNYFLMILVEQGYIGLSIFLIFLVLALLRIEARYHRSTNPDDKSLFVMTGSLIVMIITINAVNDMIEVIKIGAIFFFCLFLVSARLRDTDARSRTS